MQPVYEQQTADLISFCRNVNTLLVVYLSLALNATLLRALPLEKKQIPLLPPDWRVFP